MAASPSTPNSRKSEVSKAIARDPSAAEHLYRCPKCGQLFDSRDMAAAAKHEKPH
jgi:hypothetical protein